MKTFAFVPAALASACVLVVSAPRARAGEAPAIPIHPVISPGQPQPATKLAWASTYEDALKRAHAEHKFVLVDFYTQWCGWCKRLDSDVFSQDSFAQASKEVIPVKVDAEQRRDLAAKFSVQSYPRLFFINSDGAPVEQVQGYLNLQDFTARVKSVLAGDTQYRRFRDAASNPDDLSAAYNFARFLSDTSQVDAAIPYWQQLHDRALRQIFDNHDTGMAPAYHRQALLELGRAYMLVGIADVARQNLEDVLSGYPGTPEAMQATMLLAQIPAVAPSAAMTPVSAPAPRHP